jgi:SAM-dependent MidA family methyltransferase
MSQLPSPSEEALAHSQRLIDVIRAEIDAAGGWIDFARYMRLALYAPGLGYYSGGTKKFGQHGDFVTAPEISALFAQCLARQVAQVLSLTSGDILELGAGTGRLAAAMLLELHKLGEAPLAYRILEVSADLRQVQCETLQKSLPPELMQRVHWLDELPDEFVGLVLGNEVLDALPVHVIKVGEQGDLFECGVTWSGDGFEWSAHSLTSGPLFEQASRLGLPNTYTAELCPAASGLVASLADMLHEGILLFIDYGFPRSEYYHPQRHEGTLMCHYRHYAHDDPFLYPGLQDITAHVDFTSMAEAGVAHGLTLAGYATQAQFLINCGITDLLNEVSPSDTARYLPMAAHAQKLLSPAEMGELFKAIGLSKGITQPPFGFINGNKSHTL